MYVETWDYLNHVSRLDTLHLRRHKHIHSEQGRSELIDDACLLWPPKYRLSDPRVSTPMSSSKLPIVVDLGLEHRMLDAPEVDGLSSATSGVRATALGFLGAVAGAHRRIR